MKKFLLLAAMIAVTTAAYALSFTVDNINYTDRYNYSGMNNQAIGEDGVVVVDPSPNASGYLDFSNGVEYGGVHYDVRGFNRNAFYNNKNITGLKADSNLKLFGDDCFNGSGLQGALDIEARNIMICNSAFANTQIESLNINGPTRQTIGWYAFANCPNLSQVTFGDNYIELGQEMFTGDANLKELTYPESRFGTISPHTALKGSGIATLTLPAYIKKLYSGIEGIPLEHLIIEGDEQPLTIQGPITSTNGDFTITISRKNPPKLQNVWGEFEGVENYFPVQPSVILEGAAAENAAAYQSADGWEELAEHITTGVYNIAVEPVEAIEAPVYYNLNGMRISAEALTPGVYVKVLGTSATKILIR